ncbi:MAG: helix-turn-helix domain-containing protein [Lachnospiraceae bacterium]|nr:helix-turn-helix domain-containing protein [Lachnospiraceae bacterium]
MAISKIVSQRLGNPVLIADTAFKTLAYIPVSSPEEDLFWNVNLRLGELNPIGSHASREYGWLELYQSEKTEFFSTKDYVSKQPIQVASRGVFIEGRWVATIHSVDYNQPFPADCAAIMDEAALAVSSVLFHTDYFRANDSVLESFLRNLLSSDPEEQECRSMYRDITSENGNSKLVLAFQKGNKPGGQNDFSLQYYVEQIKPFPGVKACFIEGDHILALASLSDNDIVLFTGKVLALFHESDIFVGTSKIFQDIVDFKIYVTQARYALEMCEKDKNRCCLFEDVMIDYLLDSAGKRMDLTTCADSRLIQLMKYDEKHHTNLCDTLECYLNNQLNATTTARELNIHYNTLKNRLSLMKEIGIDFHSLDHILQLGLSLKILRS